jgi:hypothetical protein
MNQQQQAAKQKSPCTTRQRSTTSDILPSQEGRQVAHVERCHQSDSNDHAQPQHLPASPEPKCDDPSHDAEQAAQFKILRGVSIVESASRSGGLRPTGK